MQPPEGGKKHEDVTGTVVMATPQKMPNQTRSRIAVSSPKGACGERTPVRAGAVGTPTCPRLCSGHSSRWERGRGPRGVTDSHLPLSRGCWAPQETRLAAAASAPGSLLHPGCCLHPGSLLHPNSTWHPGSLLHPNFLLHPSSIPHPSSLLYPMSLLHPGSKAPLPAGAGEGGSAGPSRAVVPLAAVPGCRGQEGGQPVHGLVC